MREPTHRTEPRAGGHTPSLDAATTRGPADRRSSTAPDDSDVGMLRVVEDPIAELMGGAFALHRDGTHLIVIDPALHPWQRRVAVTHELVHLERGIVECSDAPAGWDALVEREEIRVREEVADRLAPPVAVDTLVAEHLAAGEPLSVDQFASHFQLPLDVATLALERATARRRRRRRDSDSSRRSR